jgi:mono/diheme cytochrome c family protein
MARLNAIFALSALLLLAVTGVIVMYDYVRGWKWFQWEFMRIQQERLQQELTTAQQQENKSQLAAMDKQVKAQELEIAQHRQAYMLAQKDLDSWDGKHYAADQDYRFTKATLDAARYELETAVTQHSRDLPAKRKTYDDLTNRVNQLQLRLQEVTRGRDAARARVDSWMKKIKDAEDKKKELTASIDLINKQLATVAPSSDFFILNAPMLDFIAPTFKIDQVVLPDLFVEMNYMQVPRVDRCQTCHRAIDLPGFESKKEAARLEKELQTKLDAGQITPDKREDTEKRIGQLKRVQDAPTEALNPFRTHPKLEMFVGSASPHPILEFGCTVCHKGQDRATEFGRAGHTPASGKMEARWSSATSTLLPGPWDYQKRHWGYDPNPFLETPMYPRQYYEAGCLKCHGNQVQVRGGEQITRATATVELYGCYACHKIANWRFTDLRKPGPDLNAIAEKTTPEWAVRWISEPHNFRSTTRMPSFFFQRNVVGPSVPAAERAQNIKFQDAEINAIVTYLFAKSTHRQWQPPTVAGDSGRGQQLVHSVGCMGCHVESELIKDEKSGAMRLAKRDDFPLERNFGFNFTGVGTKTHAAWLYNWVKNPKAYYPTAPMPSLRLSDQEAADITAYLMTLQKPEFLRQPVRPVDRQAVHDLAKGYLVNILSDVDAEAKLKAMPLQEQLTYLGQRSIEKYGCYSCHNIAGFEGLKPIGTDLTIEGSKALHLFDFGFVHSYQHESGKEEHILHTVPSWVYNKVRSPRVYDDLRTKAYNDKLKMPNFHLTEDEAQRITTVVLGLTKDRVDASRMAAADPASRAAEEGRKLVSQHNCRACHVVDGYGRAIASQIADTNFLPPDLSPEGGRAQSPFLYNFLKDPTVMHIRPWLSVRMPTFHFSDPEANTLVSFFAAEGKAPAFDNQYTVAPSAQNVAIGREVFDMLRCAQCHSTVPVNPENPPAPNVADTKSLAPNLTLSRIRLRHQWIPDWVRRPNEMIPNTRMPTNFPRDAASGGFQSPLAMALDSPAFAAHKTALMPLFKNDEKELKRTMGDAVALTDYLRDYIWSIGITQMRAASPTEGPSMNAPQQPPALPPPSPGLKTGSAERGAAPATAGR